MYCFCYSYGRFLRIIILVTAYRTLLKTQECSSCSTEIIVSLSAVGFSFCASASVAGESRHIHIPSSPHQRQEPRLPPWLWQGAGGTRGAGFLPSHPPQKQLSSVDGGGSRGCKWTQPPCPALPGAVGLGAGLTPRRAVGVARPAARSAPCPDVAEASVGFVELSAPALAGWKTDGVLCSVFHQILDPTLDSTASPITIMCN